MTLDIANRLVKLRKQHGLSQEELADKLGLSRQSVSKWERAEASPDTDNLICLAKLYGMSIDELLRTDGEDQENDNQEPKKDETPKDSVVITDDEGSKVIINDKKVEFVDPNGKKVEKKQKDKFLLVLDIIDGCLTGLMIFLYVFLGAMFGMWANGWVFFFIPDFVCSIIRAIYCKNGNKVNITFGCLFTYFFVCMVYPGFSASLWHPMWVVFLLIPAYHSIMGSINKIVEKNKADK